jgi:glycosyltransferase involved in cell wall biosynthesis
VITGLYILIPARNEEENISKVISDYKKYGKIVVINDCSTDKTFERSKKGTFKILSNKKKLGYDSSLREGIDFINKNKDSKYILTVDGDGQHPIINLKKIIKYMEKYDLIIFNRKKLQRTSEYIVNAISYALYRIKDPLSGMKLYKTEFLKKNKLNKNIDYVGMFFFKLYKINKILNIKIKTKNITKSSFGVGLNANIKIIKAFIRCI